MDYAKLQKKAWEDISEFQQRAADQVAQSYIDANSHVSKPFQDVSCRVQGPILYDLNHNFCQAWEESKRPSSLFRELCWLTWLPGMRIHVMAVDKIVDALHDEMDPGFIARRKALPLSAFNLPDARHNLQLTSHPAASLRKDYKGVLRQPHQADASLHLHSEPIYSIQALGRALDRVLCALTGGRLSRSSIRVHIDIDAGKRWHGSANLRCGC